MTPTFTRGPGETFGVSALETAMDELAYQLGIDPVELRLRNRATTDPPGNRLVERRASRSASVRARPASVGRRDPGA